MHDQILFGMANTHVFTSKGQHLNAHHAYNWPFTVSIASVMGYRGGGQRTRIVQMKFVYCEPDFHKSQHKLDQVAEFPVSHC